MRSRGAARRALRPPWALRGWSCSGRRHRHSRRARCPGRRHSCPGRRHQLSRRARCHETRSPGRRHACPGRRPRMPRHIGSCRTRGLCPGRRHTYRPRRPCMKLPMSTYPPTLTWRCAPQAPCRAPVAGAAAAEAEAEADADRGPRPFRMRCYGFTMPRSDETARIDETALRNVTALRCPGVTKRREVTKRHYETLRLYDAPAWTLHALSAYWRCTLYYMACSDCLDCSLAVCAASVSSSDCLRLESDCLSLLHRPRRFPR